MQVYWWVVNTPIDSGPTNYIVMAKDMDAARQAILDYPRTREHHKAAIRSKWPKILDSLQPIKI